MRGNNTFVLNTATVIEAMQEYFDKRYTPKVEVREFKVHASGYPVSPQWEVEVAEIEGDEK